MNGGDGSGEGRREKEGKKGMRIQSREKSE